MTIQHLKEKIESLGNTMNFCIEDVFSWRGAYAEPACCISSHNTTKAHNLEMLNRLTTETFYGWKGGEYTYNTYYDIHFESEWSSWTDGTFLNRFLLDNADNDDVRYIFS